MNKEIFYTIISHPYSLKTEELNVLDEIVERYPFFQVAQTLRLQNSYGKDKYERLLQQNGIHISDPRFYYHKLMLNKMYSQAEEDNENEFTVEEVGNKDINELREERTKQPTQKHIVELVTENNSEEEETLKYAPSFYKIDESNILLNDKESYNFTDWLSVLEQSSKEEVTVINPKAKKTAVTISQFINSGKNTIKKTKSTKPKEESHKYSPEQLMSQTLAEIYVKQKLYDKAIAIYEKLDLKSSEKNATFARRIDEINELKNN